MWKKAFEDVMAKSYPIKNIIQSGSLANSKQDKKRSVLKHIRIKLKS